MVVLMDLNINKIRINKEIITDESDVLILNPSKILFKQFKQVILFLVIKMKLFFNNFLYKLFFNKSVSRQKNNQKL